MSKIGKDLPVEPRKTALYEAEEWYQNLLAERLGVPYTPIQRSNFGHYNMAVHYLTSILDEAKAVNKVAVYNIDHMAQIQFSGKDASILLNRVLPANIESMKIGQCKYTLLLNENGTVRDDMIIMKEKEESFILVINAGHDITTTYAPPFVKGGSGDLIQDSTFDLISDADFILQYKKDGEEVFVKDLSDELVKVDVQGMYSYKVINDVFGKDCVKNRNNPDKNMGFFSFNDVAIDGETYYFSRTGYTNRWGWEIYMPVKQAEDKFKQIVLKALEYDGLLVGLGGRDENRMSAGDIGLPLMGAEYWDKDTPTNAPLFEAAVDMSKDTFVGKQALIDDLNNAQTMVLIIAEGNIKDNGVYIDGKRAGKVTSCIMSPNVSLEKRLHIGSTRKNVNEEDGTAAIALAWLNYPPLSKGEHNTPPFSKERLGGIIPTRIHVELFREKDGIPTGKPVLGYISPDGVNPATAAKPLKTIENL